MISSRKPGPDPGFVRGLWYALGPCLLVWAAIIWLIYSGWHA